MINSELELEIAVDTFLKQIGSLNQNSNYLNVISSLFSLLSVIGYYEKTGLSRSKIVEVLSPVRRIVGLSPFCNHLQEWPRGYQGDFETIEYLMNSKNLAKPRSIPYYIEQYALTSPVAQQHRNKVAHQSMLILEQCYKNSSQKHKARILSIACGSCPDIYTIQHLIGESCDFVLFDHDSDALELAQKRLSNIDMCCQYIQGNVFRIKKTLANVGQFNIVIASGLFDYLKDKYVIKILNTIWLNFIHSGGKLYFSNISKNNPDRLLMEYLADWQLIHRDLQELIDMCIAAGIPEGAIEYFMEPTGITWMIEANKQIQP